MLAYSNTSSSGENVNETMLHLLLTIVSGTSQMGGVPTQDILFIFAGAFENIENRYADKKHRIGFTARDEKEEISCFSDYTLRYDFWYRSANEMSPWIVSIKKKKLNFWIWMMMPEILRWMARIISGCWTDWRLQEEIIRFSYIA